MVSWLVWPSAGSLGGDQGSYSAVFSHSCQSARDLSVSRSSSWKPCSRAKRRAPSPTSMTWGVSSITWRATLIGCMMSCRKATEPALPCLVHDAGVEGDMALPVGPAAVTHAGDSGSASTTRTPCSTASRARPPFAQDLPGRLVGRQAVAPGADDQGPAAGLPPGGTILSIRFMALGLFGGPSWARAM